MKKDQLVRGGVTSKRLSFGLSNKQAAIHRSIAPLEDELASGVKSG